MARGEARHLAEEPRRRERDGTVGGPHDNDARHHHHLPDAWRIRPAGVERRPNTSLFVHGRKHGSLSAVDFKLTVTYAGGPSPLALPFTVSTGATNITITSILDTTAPVVPGLVTSAVTGDQPLRLNRNGVGSVCGALKPFPGTFGSGTRRFDAYTIDSCSTAPACVTASLASTPGANPALFATAYSPSFDPTNLATNYLADPGASIINGAFASFGFALPAASQRFVIDVNEVNQDLGLGANYTLKLSGGCFGPCTVPNQVPVAKAKNVTVSADASCHANASIDDGSFDPDGDALTITQSPAGPYPLRTTTVLLTVTDTKGATSQATGSVTVVDTRLRRSPGSPYPHAALAAEPSNGGRDGRLRRVGRCAA